MGYKGVSAVIAVKNEENNLKRCLESLRWVDEIILIDSNSGDNTLKIARKYRPKIYQFRKKKYLIEEKKNFGIKKATKGWVLIVDADEEITPELKMEILKKVSGAKEDAFMVNFKTFALGRFLKGKLWNESKIIRLFRRGKAIYKDIRPHSLLSVKGSIGRLNGSINHYAYPDTRSFIKKTERYTAMSAPFIAKSMRGGILRKKIYKINFYSRFIEPLLFVFWIFIIKNEYKDLLVGLWISILMGYYLYLERRKVKEILDRGQSWH